MNAYEEVLSWAETRPWWQQKVLARIIAGVTFGEHDYEDIARSLMEEPESPPDGGWFSNLTLPPVTQDEPVRMIAVRKLANVNRLAPGQELTFEPNGLTVVYGHNGSGKSGYARVISSMVGARHQKKILSDVFDNEPRTPSGEIVFEVGDKERTVILGQSPDPELKRIAFYDEYCGNSYLTTDAEISYRPSAVKLLEDLAVVCTGVSQVIKAWTQEKSQPTPLPRVDPQGSAGEFLRGLSASTSDDAVEAAIQCPADAAEQLEKQKIIVARLRASNPNHEKAQLLKISEELTTIADHLETLDTKVGMQAAQQLADLVANAELAQEMANLVSRRTFANEPLSEVGSSVWKVLWSAAEAYSKVAYPDHPFPYTSDGAVCVLCQQRIDAEAADRLESFQRFVMDTTVEEAKDAQSQVDKFRDGLRGLIERPEKISKAIIQLEVKKYPRVEELNSILVALRDRTLALAEGEEAHSVDVAATVAFLRKDAVTHRYQAHRVNVEEFAKQLRQAEAQERQLCDQIAMHDGWQLIEDERTRLQAKEKLEKKLSETNTASITKKVGELTRAYVTQEADEFFTREAQNLGLEHVRFRATSARQGSQFHRTEF